MKITRLPRGNAQFPSEKDPGDIVVLSNGDSFVWSKAIWNLIGGRYLKPEVREWMLDYIKEGWPTPSDAKFDLGEMISITGEDPEARRWTNMAINNIIKVAKIYKQKEFLNGKSKSKDRRGKSRDRQD